MTTATKTNWRELLPHYCDAKYRDVTDSYSVIGRPWLITWRESTWTAATDGRLLLVVAGEHCDDTASEGSRKQILDIVHEFSKRRKKVNVTELKEWCKEPHSLELVRCPECMGSRIQTCEHCDSTIDCDRCDGKGKTFDTRSRLPGNLRGVNIDRALLAHLLRGIDDETARVGVMDHNIRLFGDDWLAVLMGPHGGMEAPKFERRDSESRPHGG